MKTNYENETMLDMIFEQRNKTYGAYALRKNYDRRIATALLLMFTAVFLLCFGKFLADKLKPKQHSTVEHFTVVETTAPIVMPQKKAVIAPPKLPKLAATQAIPTQCNTEMKVVTNSEVKLDSIPAVVENRNTESGTTNTTTGNLLGSSSGTGTQQTTGTTTDAMVEEDYTIHTTVEIMPEFPGGDKKLMEFLSRNTSYPAFEKEMGIEGKAYTKFVVNEDGTISNVETFKSETKGFSNEAKRVVALLPKFKPGMQQGRAVKVQFVLPFSFRLGND